MPKLPGAGFFYLCFLNFLFLAMAGKIIYLDYNATTPVDAAVFEQMLPWFSERFGNAASHTHLPGRAAARAVEEARTQVAQLIGSESGEVFFSSGATEALNLAIKGVAQAYRSKGNHIVAAATEHSAVLDTCRSLEKKGAGLTIVPVDGNGLADRESLAASITDATVLVAVMYANNETGVIQPIREIADLVHERKSILLSDATQAAGKINLDVNRDGIDLLALSAHKLYGPKGCGALYVRRKNPRVALSPQMEGGGHERGLRSGTPNVPGIVGLGAACALASSVMEGEGRRLGLLRDRLEQSLCAAGGVTVNGLGALRLPHVVNITVPDLRADRLIAALPRLALATGSACTSALPEPSHVLTAMGLSDEQARCSIRISLGRPVTEAEADEAAAMLNAAISRLRKGN